MPQWPMVKTAGNTINKLGKVAKPLCAIFGHLTTLVKVYNTCKWVLDKFGINVL